jgi:predicted nucleic acid-binding protein
VKRESVLDSYALLAYLFGESGHEAVTTLLERKAEEDADALMSAVNWAEVRYIIERKAGLKKWEELKGRIRALPIEIVEVSAEQAESAGALKASRKMSLADCFAAALAIMHDAELYTGDPEFKTVENEVRVVWI